MTALNDRYLDFVLFAAYTIASVTGLILLKSNMVAAKGLVVRMDWLAAPVALASQELFSTSEALRFG